MKPKHIIWSNYYFDLDDWCKEDYLESAGIDEDDFDEDDFYDWAWNVNEEYLEDYLAEFESIKGEALIIADCGRWNGRIESFDFRSSLADAIREVRSLYDLCEIFVDCFGEIRIDGYHHDGYDHYTVRRLTTDKDDFLAAVEESDFTSAVETTESFAQAVSSIYGW